MALPPAVQEVTALAAYRKGVLAAARRKHDSLLLYVEPTGRRRTVARVSGFIHHISTRSGRFAASSDDVGRRSVLLVGSGVTRPPRTVQIPPAVNQVFAVSWLNGGGLVVAGQHLQGGAPTRAAVLMSFDGGRHWIDNTPPQTHDLSDLAVTASGLLAVKIARGERTFTLVQQARASTSWRTVDPAPLPFQDRVDLFPTPRGYWLSGLNLYWLPRGNKSHEALL